MTTTITTRLNAAGHCGSSSRSSSEKHYRQLGSIQNGIIFTSFQRPSSFFGIVVKQHHYYHYRPHPMFEIEILNRMCRESGKGKLSGNDRKRGSAATEAPRGSNARVEAGGSSKSRPFLQRGGGRGAHMRSSNRGKNNTTSSTNYSTTTFARNRSTRMY